MNSCNAYGKCDQGPDCPVRETPMHTGNGGAHVDTDDLPIVMYDEPIRLRDIGLDAVWWIGTAALVVLLFAALYLIGRTI